MIAATPVLDERVDELEDLIWWLNEVRARAIARPASPPRWVPSRPCRCARPLALQDGPRWVRCLKCGRDVHEARS